MRLDRRSLDKLTPCDALKVIDYDIREAEDTLGRLVDDTTANRASLRRHIKRLERLRKDYE